MNDTIVRTKVVPPRRRPDLYTRQRLVELLDELMGNKLTILVAPAGYGKTYALIDFAHYTELPVCWYSLDPLDRDPHRFFMHFIAAIAQRYPVFGRTAQAALQNYSARQGSLDQLITVVVNELYEHAPEDFLLILDDYHLVAEDEDIGRFVSQFVQQADENCHLLLASRGLLALPDMPLLVARGYVSGLDFEDLAFEREELQKLILQNYGHSLSDREAADLIKTTEGWITGLLLSTQSNIRNVSERMRRLRAAGIDLYDYLAQQVLDQQTPALRDFLLWTGLTEEFNAELCSTLFDEAWLSPGVTWAGLIEELFRQNLFAVRVGENGDWLRYHNLFQEFLQKQLVKERPDDEILILNRLASHHASNKEWEKAHRCYQRLGDVEAIADLIEAAGYSLIRSGRILLLAGWIDGLPSDLLQARPLLLSLRGDVLGRKGDVEQALAVLNRAAMLLDESADWLNLARTLVRRAIIHRLRGDYSLSLADSDHALAALARKAPNAQQAAPGEATAVKAQALLAQGVSLHTTGQFQPAVTALQESLLLNQEIDDRAGLTTASMELATVYTNTGQYGQALSLYQFCLDEYHQSANLSAQAMVLNNLGVLHHLQGDYVQALERLSDAYDAAQRSGYTRFVSFALTGIGDLFADLEMWQTSLKVYREAWAIAQRLNERFMVVYLKLVMARAAGEIGAWRDAFEHLSTASTLVLDRSSDYEWALYQLAMGRYYLGQNKAEEAIAPLEDAKGRFVQGGQPVEEAIVTFLLATALHASHHAPGQVSEHLTHGLAIAFTLESRQPLIAALRSIQSIIQPGMVSGAARERAKQLTGEIAHFASQAPLISRQMRQHVSPHLAHLLLEAPPRLVIHTLGRAEVTLDGKLISNREWQTQVSRDIFFCLLSNPAGLTKEEVGAHFWADASPTELRSRFKNAMYRLRSALHPDVILFDDEIYRFNRAFDYEYDVEVFLNKIAEGDVSTDTRARIAAYSAAIQCYRGPYLPDLEGAWAWAEREHLHRLFTDTILTVAQLQLEQGEYRSALQSCQRALVDDPCLEEAHRIAMRIYAAMGNRAAVARQYALCRQALLNEIDVPPSPQTEELYTLLMHA